MHYLIDKYYKVLDNGFIALKDFMGSDEGIERVARVSYGKGTRKTSDTRHLLRYMYSHAHTSPFESCELQFHVKAPIYVFRQWHRHRTWSYSEYSGRYSEMTEDCEKTKEWRTQSIDNKQGSGGPIKEFPDSHKYPNLVHGYKNPQDYLKNSELIIHEKSRKIYEERLKFGVAKEQARKDLPVSNYSEMYAKTNLKNLLHFMSLRCDSHAQLEIRLYANIIAGIVKELFPLTFEAWQDYSFNGCSFSYQEIKLLNFQMGLKNLDFVVKLDSGECPLLNKSQELGMSKREFEEFSNKLKIKELQNFDLSDKELLVV